METNNISPSYTDENVTRLIALQVISIILLAFVNDRTHLLWILTLDFGWRAFTNFTSPTAIIAKTILQVFNVKPKLIFQAPKKFAAAVGFIFSLIITILMIFNLRNTAIIVSTILALFAFLEAAFKICVGCYVFNWLIVPIISKRSKLKMKDLD